MTGAETPTPGRPRSDRAREQILAAAWELFGELGLRAMSVESIAARAGVGKTTIYRWWPSKAAVVLDALRETVGAGIAFPDTGSVRTDLTRQLNAVIRLLASPPGRAYLALVAESHHDPALAEALRERYIVHRRELATVAITRGVERGELPDDTDAGVVIDALYGAVYYRLLVSHEPVPRRYAGDLVRTVLGV